MNNKITSLYNTMEELKAGFKNIPLTGYIWMVEENAPYVYESQIIDFDNLNRTGNPFNKIQEAYLTDGIHSIHIKTVDGKEKIYVFKPEDFENHSYYRIDPEEHYPSHLIKRAGIRSVSFRQVYERKENLSKGFYIWQPVVKLFTGMNKK